MTHYEAAYYLVTGIAIGASIRPLYRRLCRWADGLHAEADDRRTLSPRCYGTPRSVPEPRNLRLLRTPYDHGSEATS